MRLVVRLREKDFQFLPEPRRPWRMKAVAVYGLSLLDWISSNARVCKDREVVVEWWRIGGVFRV